MTVTDRVLQNAVACSVPISGRKTSNSCPQCRKEPLEIVVDPRLESLGLLCTALIIILGVTGLVGLVE